MKARAYPLILALCLLATFYGGVGLAGECDPPPFISAGASPMVMMVMERDHKLYYEAYNDAQDLDGDGLLDVGYKHSIDYYGYFDPYKCYTYSTTGQHKFIPTRYSATKYCGGSGEWSGNFLNWLSMSRMDVLKRVLYGGQRSSDNSSETVLEGVYIPQDSHSWGKEYAGSDTRQLTPFDPPSSGRRHLFCVTSLGSGQPHVIRVARNDTHRVWEWATTERAVCSGPETPWGYRQGPVGTRNDILDYTVRVKVCSTDWDKGLEQDYCKLYPGGGTTPKPVGLLQKYGEGDGSKVCSKTYKPCQADNDCGTGEGLCVFQSPLYMGLLTGSYEKNLSGGVLRKNIWTVMDEINSQSGSFQSSENVQGNIILTLDRMRPVGFRYSDYSYQASDGGTCGWITARALQEGECRMWGNPVGEMMYEALRFITGKGSPTSAFTYSGNDDAGLDLSKPDWFIKKGNQNLVPFDLFPDCSKPNLLVLSDINPSYDSDQLPGSAFGSFTGDLAGLNVSSLANVIGTAEGLSSGNFFVGQSGSVYDFICTAKNITNLSSIRGLCPEEPTKQGSFYSAAVAYYGKSQITAQEGIPDVTTYAVAMSSPIPDINVKVGNNYVRLVPIGKSVSGSHGTKGACADKCTVTRDTDGLHITNCTSTAYCPSNQIVDFYVDTVTYDAGGNLTYAKFRVNFEDVEQGADHDMDAIVIYEIEPVGSSQVKVKLTSEYAAGSIDQVLGFIVSGTTADGVYLPVRDKDATSDGDTPSTVGNLPLVWEKTFTVSGNPAGTLKNPLWFAAKWGGFDDINGNDIPDLQNEWDKDGDGVPDNYFFVANPLELEQKLEKAMVAILSKAGSAGAVATVTQEVLGQDLVIRGAFTTYEQDASTYAWKGHLEAYWPYEGCAAMTSMGQSVCESYAGCEWFAGQCMGSLYSFQKTENLEKFCSDPGFSDGNCWDAGKILSTASPGSRCLFTSLSGTMTKLDDGTSTCSRPFYTSLATNTASIRSALANNLDFDGDADTDNDDADALIRWIRGHWDNSWEGTARDRDGWSLGDIVYSTPVVVGPPSVSSVDPNLAGSCSDCTSSCGATSFYCYREAQKTRKKVVYVGANDGMLHAFVVGVWWADSSPNTDSDGDGEADESHWIYNPDEPDSECDGATCTGKDQVGKELWAYVPSNLLPELKELARADYGHQTGCAHRTMVDLSPIAWEVFIDHDGDGDREWRTVLLGGERGGGDVYFALDVTDPDNPKVLWEYSILRNMVLKLTGGSGTTDATPFLDKTVYDQARTLPVSWTIPYVGYLNVPSGVCFDTNTRVEPLQAGSPGVSTACRGAGALSGWFAILGATPRIFQPDVELPASLSSAEKTALLKPYLVALDIEKGINIFQHLWPTIVHQWSSQWPTVTSGANTIPYALGDPLVLDIWNANGTVGSDGVLDHIYFGDLNGNFYGLKFNLDSSSPGIKMEVWKTKPASGTNLYRSSRQPITVMPVATLDPDKYLRIFFGTGKFDNVIGGQDDRTDTATMSFYGLKDSTVRPTAFSGGITVDGLAVSADFQCGSSSFESGCQWVESDGSPDCCESTCSGACWTCVQDLFVPGERVVDSALIAGGVVFFTSFVPKDDPCAAGGDAYLYAVDYQCGALSTDPFSTSGFTQVSTTTANLGAGQYTTVKDGTQVKAYVLKIGEGMPSRPVMDSSGQYIFIQTSNGRIHRLRVNLPDPVERMGWKQQ